MFTEGAKQLFNTLYRQYNHFDTNQLKEEMEKTIPSLKEATDKEFRKAATISALAIFTNQIQLHLPLSLGNIDKIFEYFSSSPCYPYLDSIK